MTKNTSNHVRKPARKINYQHSAKGLTSQSGIVPVIHFLKCLGFDDEADQGVTHKSAVVRVVDRFKADGCSNE